MSGLELRADPLPSCHQPVGPQEGPETEAGRQGGVVNAGTGPASSNPATCRYLPE